MNKCIYLYKINKVKYKSPYFCKIFLRMNLICIYIGFNYFMKLFTCNCWIDMNKIRLFRTCQLNTKLKKIEQLLESTKINSIMFLCLGVSAIHSYKVNKTRVFAVNHLLVYT